MRTDLYFHIDIIYQILKIYQNLQPEELFCIMIRKDIDWKTFHKEKTKEID